MGWMYYSKPYRKHRAEREEREAVGWMYYSKPYRKHPKIRIYDIIIVLKTSWVLKFNLKFRVSNNPIGGIPIILLQIVCSLQCFEQHYSQHSLLCHTPNIQGISTWIPIDWFFLLYYRNNYRLDSYMQDSHTSPLSPPLRLYILSFLAVRDTTSFWVYTSYFLLYCHLCPFLYF